MPPTRAGAIDGARRAAFVVGVAFAVWFACSAHALALNGRWQPPDIGPTTATLADILGKYRRALGTPELRYAQRVERYALQTGRVKLDSTFTVSGDDFRAETTIDGALYEQGRTKNFRWRRTPAGLVRIVESDIQGDDLDRWPAAILPIHDGDSTLLGESRGLSPAWVIEYRSPHGYPHWFYVDEATGTITREITREGSRVNSFTFDDFRPIAGTRRPYHWRVSGGEGSIDVTVESVEFVPLAADALAIPVSRSDFAAVPAGGPVELPARFDRGEIALETLVDGHPFKFQLDSGTTQIIVDERLASRLGVHATLGHAIVGDLAVGPVHIRNANVLTVPLEGFALGLLGYDFFAGHIVHIDYAHRRVELVDRATFSPPPAAWLLDAWCGEGLPLIAVPFGRDIAQRFALDTGSQDLLVLQYLFERDGFRTGAIGLGKPSGRDVLRFLEGPVTVQRARLDSFRIGPAAIRDIPALVEVLNGGTAIEAPLDGIVGTHIMGGFEWWFDYDGNRVWFQPA